MHVDTYVFSVCVYINVLSYVYACMVYIYADKRAAYLRKRYHQDNEAFVAFTIYGIMKAVRD